MIPITVYTTKDGLLFIEPKLVDSLQEAKKYEEQGCEVRFGHI